MSEETKDMELEQTQVIGGAEVREGGEVQAGAPELEKGRKALSRNTKIGIAAGCAATSAAAVVGVCLWSNQPATLPADEPEGKALVAEAEEGAGNADEAETKTSEPSSGVDAGQLAAPAGSGGDNGQNGGDASAAPAAKPSNTPSASQPSGGVGSSQPEHVHN